jgi:hypothetical protein
VLGAVVGSMRSELGATTHLAESAAAEGLSAQVRLQWTGPRSALYCRRATVQSAALLSPGAIELGSAESGAGRRRLLRGRSRCTRDRCTALSA